MGEGAGGPYMKFSMVRLGSAIGLALVVVATAGTAAPQTGMPQAGVPQATYAPPTAAGFAGQPPSTVSPAEMLQQGREYRSQVEAIGLQMQNQVQQAKADKDVIRLNCLLDKFTQLKVNGNMMDQALQSLQDMISQRDEGAQLHAYTRITIINQKVQVLRTEADACVGTETNYVGPTKIYVEVPPGITSGTDDPPPAEPPVVIIQRPPAGSPYE
jgi:hypothetical protein